jgi:hypothetical protein
MSKKYKQLKILLKLIETFEEDNIDKFYKFLKDNIKEEIKKIIPPNKSIKKCFPFYINICNVLNPDGSILKESIEKKKYEIIQSEYHILKKYIIEKRLRNMTLDKERTLLQNMIPCLYFYSSKTAKPYQSFWNTFTDNRSWVVKKREEFRKNFRYFVYDKKFILTNLNQKSGSKVWDGKKGTPVDYFISGNSPLVLFLKHVMKTNQTSVSPLESYSAKKYKYHIYISIFTINKKYYVYVGKAKENTRYRWGYQTGHLYEVFHYIVRAGAFNFPKQITDLWTLYFGPDHQVICTLATDVLKSEINHVEKAYQYLFEFNKKQLGITNYLHDVLKAKSAAQLDKKVKYHYDIFKKQLDGFLSIFH